MIYLFTGDDAANKRKSYEKFLKSLPKGMETFSIGRNNFNYMEVESLYSGAGLFFAKCAIVFDNILEREDIRDFILDKLSLMAESENLFIFSEGKLNKPIIDVFKKAKAELSVFEMPKVKAEKFNSFQLANAFGAKDKLNLWIYFRQAMDSGVGLEELVGILFWKVKDMILKNNFTKFSESELRSFSSRLSYLLPEARHEGRDAEAALEQFLLEVF